MPYTRITHTAHGYDALKYSRGNGHGHNNNDLRNELILGVGMLADDVVPFEQQMLEDWNHASAKNKNQIRRIIASFSPDELYPDDEASVYIAGQIGVEFCEEFYPGHKTAIFVQKDGKSGLVHLHMDVCNVNSITWKGCTDEQCRASWVAEKFDIVAQRFIDLSTGIGMPSKENEIGFEDTSSPEKKSTNPYVRKLREDGKYVWRDDLTERVEHVIDERSFKSYDEFIKILGEYGVGAEYHETKKGKRYFTYELLDTDGFTMYNCSIPKNGTKAKSYKLSQFCDVDYIDQQIENRIGVEKIWTEQGKEIPEDDDSDYRITYGFPPEEDTEYYDYNEFYPEDDDGYEDEDDSYDASYDVSDDETDDWDYEYGSHRHKKQDEDTEEDEPSDEIESPALSGYEPVVGPMVTEYVDGSENEESDDDVPVSDDNVESEISSEDIDSVEGSDLEEPELEKPDLGSSDLDANTNAKSVVKQNERQNMALASETIRRTWVSDEQRERQRVKQQAMENLRIKLQSRYGSTFAVDENKNRVDLSAYEIPEKTDEDLQKRANRLRRENNERIATLKSDRGMNDLFNAIEARVDDYEDNKGIDIEDDEDDWDYEG